MCLSQGSKLVFFSYYKMINASSFQACGVLAGIRGVNLIVKLEPGTVFYSDEPDKCEEPRRLKDELVPGQEPAPRSACSLTLLDGSPSISKVILDHVEGILVSKYFRSYFFTKHIFRLISKS